jgi:hypothetical protein
MEISLIHPSRQRPQKSFDTISYWISKSVNVNNFELIISLDADDPTLETYKNLYNNLHIRKTVLVSENNYAVQAINNAAKCAIGRIMIVVSDDTSCPAAWDSKILRYTIGKSDFVLRVRDGIQPRIITAPIVDRVYYQRDGYIYNPEYDHCWADREFTEVAYKRKRVIEKQIMFRHLHYSVSKNKKRDEQYARTDATFDKGKAIYNRRKLINFGL